MFIQFNFFQIFLTGCVEKHKTDRSSICHQKGWQICFGDQIFSSRKLSFPVQPERFTNQRRNKNHYPYSHRSKCNVDSPCPSRWGSIGSDMLLFCKQSSFDNFRDHSCQNWLLIVKQKMGILSFTMSNKFHAFQVV